MLVQTMLRLVSSGLPARLMLRSGVLLTLRLFRLSSPLRSSDSILAPEMLKLLMFFTFSSVKDVGMASPLMPSIQRSL